MIFITGKEITFANQGDLNTTPLTNNFESVVHKLNWAIEMDQ